MVPLRFLSRPVSLCRGDDMKPEHCDPSKPEHFAGQQGRWAYYAYQRQLYEDVDLDNIEQYRVDHHWHIFGELGLFFVDIRGFRSWNFDSQVTLGKDRCWFVFFTILTRVRVGLAWPRATRIPPVLSHLLRRQTMGRSQSSVL